MTWIVPSTPVFGRADESVEDAPTHQVGSGEDSLGRVVVGIEEGAGIRNVTANAAHTTKRTTTVGAAVFNDIFSLFLLNRRCGTAF